MKHGPFKAASNAMANECEKCGQLFGLFSLSAGPPSIEGCEGVREGQPYPATKPSDADRLSSIGDFYSRPVQTGVKPKQEVLWDMRRLAEHLGIPDDAKVSDSAFVTAQVKFLAGDRDEWKRRAEFAEARISVGPPDKKLTVAKGFAGWLPDATTEPILYSADRMGSQIRHCVVCAKAQPVDDFNMTIDRMKSVGEHGDAEDSYVCDEHAPAVSKALVDMHLRWLESGDRSNDVDPIDLLADDA